MREQGPTEEDKVRMVGEFADPALEDAYRQKYAPQDRLFGRVIVTASALVVVGLGLMDQSVLANDTAVWGMRVVRVVFFVLSAVALFLLRGQPSPTRFTWVFCGWNLLAVALHVYGGWVLPAGDSELRLVAAVAVFMPYCVLPLTLRYQTGIALANTAAALVVSIWLNPNTEHPTVVNDLCWLGLINVLGVFMSYRLHSRQRRLFAAVRRQTELSCNLGRALAEVRTLRGLIRVCAWCRKVDSEGVWQQLEAYVKDHSHAEFTHGICPTCLDATCRELKAETVCQ
jgi:hypothetical protein